MKRDKIYTCFLGMAFIGSVLKAHCKCPAGIDGHCNHVASTLFALEQHFKDRQMSPVHLSLVSGVFQRNARGW